MDASRMAALLLFVSGCAFGGSIATEPRVSCALDPRAAVVLELSSARREQMGMGPVACAPALLEVVDAHARRTCELGFFGPVTPGVGSFEEEAGLGVEEVVAFTRYASVVELADDPRLYAPELTELALVYVECGADEPGGTVALPRWVVLGRAGPRGGPPRDGLDAEERALLRLHDAERAMADAPTLTLDPALVEAARTHADDMCERDYLSATSPEGVTSVERMRDAGAELVAGVESVARGQSAAEAFDAWWRSGGHRARALDPGFTRVGVARRPCGADTLWVIGLAD